MGSSRRIGSVVPPGCRRAVFGATVTGGAGGQFDTDSRRAQRRGAHLVVGFSSDRNITAKSPTARKVVTDSDNLWFDLRGGLRSRIAAYLPSGLPLGSRVTCVEKGAQQDSASFPRERAYY
jgi:hypothetical protein